MADEKSKFTKTIQAAAWTVLASAGMNAEAQQPQPQPVDPMFDMIVEMKTPYDRDLRHARELADKIVPQVSNEKHVVFLDPERYLLARDMGLDDKYLQQSIAGAIASLSDDPQNQFSKRDIRHEVDAYGQVDKDAYGRTTWPVTEYMNLDGDKGGVCAIVPADMVTVKDFSIPGLSRDQTATYINTHELYHCVHGRAYGRENRQKREMFADLGSVGQMIAEGAPLSVIDSIAAWRVTARRDADHLTEDGLYLMKEKISEMGEDKFRAMDDKQRVAFYYKVVDSAALTDAQFSVAEEYVSSKTGFGIAAWIDDVYSHISKDTKRAVELVNKQSPELPMATRPMTAGEHDALMQWDAVGSVCDRAVYDYGRVTPSTFLAATNTLVRELNEAQKSDPTNPSYNVMVGKLQNNVTEAERDVKTYVYWNQNRHVTLAKVDIDEIVKMSDMTGSKHTEQDIAALKKMYDPQFDAWTVPPWNQLMPPPNGPIEAAIQDPPKKVASAAETLSAAGFELPPAPKKI